MFGVKRQGLLFTCGKATHVNGLKFISPFLSIFSPSSDMTQEILFNNRHGSLKVYWHIPTFPSLSYADFRSVARATPSIFHRARSKLREKQEIAALLQLQYHYHRRPNRGDGLLPSQGEMPAPVLSSNIFSLHANSIVDKKRPTFFSLVMQRTNGNQPRPPSLCRRRRASAWRCGRKLQTLKCAQVKRFE